LSSWLDAYAEWNFRILFLIINSLLFCHTCYRAHAQAAANMQQQQQQHTPGGLPPGMIHPTSHSPLQLQPPGPTQPHVSGLYVGSSVQIPSNRFSCSLSTLTFQSQNPLGYRDEEHLSFHCMFFESGSKVKTSIYHLLGVYFMLVAKTKLDHLGN
jgi:hypothetical protein